MMGRSARIERKTVKVQSYYDIALVLLTVFLCVFGLVMIYSISSFNASRYNDDAKYYLKRQIVFVAAGIVIMLLVSMIDYHIYFKKWGRSRINVAIIALVVGSLLQIYVTVFGRSAGGSSRWIPLPGGFNLQPSELLKLIIILFVAYAVSVAPGKLDRWTGVLRIMAYIAIPVILVAGENLSTGIILAVIVFGVCFVASKRVLYFLGYGALLGGAGVLFIVLKGYRTDRVEAWLNVETSPKAQQIRQGLYAIASGGLLGKGLGEGVQKLGNIQEAHTDMIFSAICEEIGMLGGIAILAVFLMIIWRLFKIAINAPDLCGGMIATGVMINVAFQVLINIAVVTNTIPSTGIPLPFISYGGSSMLVLMAEIGLALSVSNQTVREL